jgi:hypothetical protein
MDRAQLLVAKEVALGFANWSMIRQRKAHPPVTIFELREVHHGCAKADAGQ